MHVHDQDRLANVTRIRKGKQVSQVKTGIALGKSNVGSGIVVRHGVGLRVAIMINYTRGVEMKPSYDGMEQSGLRFLPAPQAGIDRHLAQALPLLELFSHVPSSGFGRRRTPDVRRSVRSDRRDLLQPPSWP